MFKELIGQDHIKSSLQFYVEASNRGGAVPPLLFTGARGLGKTEFARQMAKNLKKPVLELNCSTIKNNTQFFEQIFVPIVMGNEIVLIFDECHALPKELQNAFLTVFNVEKHTRKHFEWQGSTMEFDFTKQTYLFATTEPDKIFTPLKDRFEEIDFRPYTEIELSSILKKRADWVDVDVALLPVIADTLRGNARSAVKRAKQIEMFCETKNVSKFGVPAVVAINKFIADTSAEHDLIKELCTAIGTKAILCSHWAEGSKGTLELSIVTFAGMRGVRLRSVAEYRGDQSERRSAAAIPNMSYTMLMGSPG
jgi:Holliday junction resolvasome RuvABC ATP-dependent DNA helicase subunit